MFEEQIEDNVLINQQHPPQKPTSTSTPVKTLGKNEFLFTFTPAINSNILEDMLIPHPMEKQQVQMAETEPTTIPEHKFGKFSFQVDLDPVINTEEKEKSDTTNNEIPIKKSEYEENEQETLNLTKDAVVLFPPLAIGLPMDTNKLISNLPLKKRSIREISEPQRASAIIQTPQASVSFPVSFPLSQIKLSTPSFSPNLKLSKLSLSEKDKSNRSTSYNENTNEKPRHKIVVAKNLEKQRVPSPHQDSLVVEVPLKLVKLHHLSNTNDKMIKESPISSPQLSCTEEPPSDVFAGESDANIADSSIKERNNLKSVTSNQSSQKRRKSSSKHVNKKSRYIVRIPLTSLANPLQFTKGKVLTVETSMVSEVSSIEGVDVSYGNDSNYLCPQCGEGYNGNLMIACDGYCQDVWFHGYCVGIEVVPNGKWRCTDCLSKNNIKHTKHKLSEQEFSPSSHSDTEVLDV